MDPFTNNRIQPKILFALLQKVKEMTLLQWSISNTDENKRGELSINRRRATNGRIQLEILPAPLQKVKEVVLLQWSVCNTAENKRGEVAT